MEDVEGDGDGIFIEYSIFFVTIVIFRDLIENFHIMYGSNYKFLNDRDQIKN